MHSNRAIVNNSCVHAYVRASLVIVLAASPLTSGCASTSSARPSSAASPTELPAAASRDTATMIEGRHWARKFYERDTEALWNQFTPRMQAAMKSKKDVDDFRTQFEEQAGKESKVVEEHVEHESKGTIYVRSSTFERANAPVVLRIGFDESGRIGLFGIRPAEQPKEAPTDHLGYVDRTPLRLPFEGTWTVAWGGRTLAQNRHAIARDQRFAYDFFIAKDDKSYRTSGRDNADYFCFGQAVLAPGAGTVVAVVDGIADNKPGQMNPDQVLGNHVVIDHGQNEFSFLAHLKSASTRVKVGERVEAGAPIGACGNSGNSSEPHLHYHLQNTAVFAQGDGLPAQFHNYTSSGRLVESGEPTRAERVINGRE